MHARLSTKYCSFSTYCGYTGAQPVSRTASSPAAGIEGRLEYRDMRASTTRRHEVRSRHILRPPRARPLPVALEGDQVPRRAGDAVSALRRGRLGQFQQDAGSVRRGRFAGNGSCSLDGFVQGHGGANERLQRLLVYLLALMEVDGTPCVPLETRVEEARRILQGRPLGEGHLHDVLVGLAGADQSVVRPHRNPSPLPLLDAVGIGFLDQGAEPAEHLAPPVAELLDPRVYQLRGRHAFLVRGLSLDRFCCPVPRLSFL